MTDRFSPLAFDTELGGFIDEVTGLLYVFPEFDGPSEADGWEYMGRVIVPTSARTSAKLYRKRRHD